MKVLFIHNTIPEYRITFFKELAKQVELTILVTDKKLAGKVYGLSFNGLEELQVIYADSLCDIGKQFLQDKYELVVLPPVDTPYQWICAWLAYRMCKKYSVKFIYWTEKWEPAKLLQPFKKRVKNYIQAKMIAYFAKRANRTVAAGKQSYKYLKSLGIDPRDISIAVDSSTSPQVTENNKFNLKIRLNLPTDSKIILFLGRIVERKGCEDLMKAFARLKDTISKSYLIICGDGPRFGDYLAISEKIDRERIIFCGKINPNIRAEYFKQADVFILPSYTLDGVIEAWGLTVNEALEQGTPVIATTAVGAAYDLADGKNCIMVKEHDDKELADAIINILGYSKNVSSCKALYNNFSVSHMASSFKNIFDKTLSQD